MFDDIIRDKANEHAAPVPPDAWDNIAKKKKKRRFAFWWWGAGLLLMFGISGVWMYADRKTGSHAVADTTTMSTKDVTEDESKNGLKSDGTEQLAVSTEPKFSIGESKQEENEIPAATSSNVSAVKGSVSAKARAAITAAATGNDNSNAVSVATRKSKKTGSRSKWKQQPGSIEEPADNKNHNNAVAEEVTAPKLATTMDQELPAIADTKNNMAITSISVSMQPDTATTATVTAVDKTGRNENANNNTKQITTQNKQSKKRHWYVDAGCMPVVALQRYDVPVSFNRTLFLNNNLTQYNASLISTSIEPAVAFSVTVRKDISQKISIGTGLQYLMLKEKVSISGKETTTSYSTVQRLQNGVLVTDTVATVQEGIRSINAMNSYQLYSIPVFLQYGFLHSKQWNVSAAAGMYFNIAAHYQNSINDNATALLINSTGGNDGTSLGYDLFTGIRLAKSFGTRLELFAMPSLRWSINNPVVKNSLINKTIHQAGLGLGMTYRFF